MKHDVTLIEQVYSCLLSNCDMNKMRLKGTVTPLEMFGNSYNFYIITVT